MPLCGELVSGHPLWTSGTTETPLYVTVQVNGNTTTTGLEIGAFVDGECRATATTASYLGGTAYRLRVWGTSDDLNKTITLKAFYNNIVYRFTTTQTFDGETSTHDVPVTLYLDQVMGFTVTDPINIEASLPAVRDLSSDVSITYDEVNRKNKSVVETEFTYTWTPAAAIMTVEGNTLTATAITPPDGITVTLNVAGENYGSNVAVKQYTFETSTQVIVVEPVIAVTSITLSPTTIEANVGDNYNAKIQELVTITVLPNNASNKNWNANVDYVNSTATETDNNITGPGVLKVIISSESDPSVTATLTINVPTPVSFNYPAELTLSKLHSTAVAFTNFEGDNFDKSLITITFADATCGLPCASATMSDDTGLNWNFTGLYVGDYTYQVNYDGQAMESTASGSAGILHIPAEVALNNAGWDWISLYAYQSGQTNYALTDGGDYLAWMNTDTNNKIIEIRSQTALLYNDATWGFIGDVTELSPEGGMYKVKAAYENASSCIINLGSSCVPISSTAAVYNTIQTGYTWISYPLETATTIAETQLATTAQTGDKIIGKTTSAEYNGTAWLPTDFALDPGKGYIYYTSGAGGFIPNFDAPTPAGVKGERVVTTQTQTISEPSPWQYDASPFADNMPVVAALEGLETGERFSIGAFVGDECRGEGKVVDGNIFIINVAGKSGELVRFRLYNKATGEFTDLDQSLIYAAQHGSLRAPVALSGSGVVDGIRTMEQPTQDSETTYNLAGQKVGRNFRGIIIRNGQKFVK
ncbi:MAG: hypothetical protein K6C30_08690 [Bacteroidaceae bacterium]|nr:hypothetical protein [Bacteroidaceae bacterium]